MSSAEEELNALRHELKTKAIEIQNNNKLIAKLMKEKEISNKYNNELNNEMKILSAKLHLHQHISKSATNCVKTQTDLSLIGHQISDNRVCIKCQKALNSCDTTVENDWKLNSGTNSLRISDLVRETAEEVVQKNEFESDYVYDPKSNTYCSRSTGWYYYPDSYLFYDPNTKNYYKYNTDTKEYEFYSSLKQMDKKRQNVTKSSKLKKLKTNNGKLENNVCEEETIEISSEEEEGEIDDSDDNSVVSDDDLGSDDNNEDKSEVSPPLVRLIVKQSTTLEIGSLLLVTCMGAKVGNDSNCDLWITDESVSRSHAEIRYDYNDKQYLIKDMNSTNGTFTNGTRIRGDSEEVLKHCDEISFGKCKLLVHIHWGRDVTCDRCEPGLVIANLKSNTKPTENTVYEQKDRDFERKTQLKKLKDKYGLKNAAFCEHKVPIISNIKYKDRAQTRREEKGSDNPYEKTAAGTSLDTALSDSNKGFQLLSKMGWTAGQALGRLQNGIVEPVNVINGELKSQP